jgi:class 3 adenylate cyclase/tetratricopeptide (TPR) repeat protein
VREDRRLVTAVFADLRGSTALAEKHDVEDVRDLLAWFTTSAITAVENFGGVVNDLAGDGLLALFGAPTASEDDPERAVRAGLAFQEAMVEVSERAERELGFGDVAARVGIETGRVVAGPMGGGAWVEYGVTGDALNVAARLQGLCPVGAVLVGPETFRQVEPRFRWGAPVVMQLKGRTAAVRARVVLSLAGPEHPPVERSDFRHVPAQLIVGRTAELASLSTSVAALSDGVGQAVLVSGDVGVGKTTLVRSVTELAVADGARVWSLTCSPWEQATPFAGVHSLMSSDGLVTDDGSPQAQRLAVLQAVRRLARQAMSAGPLVVLVEDLQWADPSTLEAVGALAEEAQVGPLLLLATTRGGLDATRGLPDDVASTHVSLGPLRHEDARSLLEKLVDPARLPADLVRSVLAAAGGSPLYLHQMARGLVDAGLRDGSTADQAREAAREVGIPASLERLFQSRMDQLGQVAAEVLTAVSVFGRNFGTDLALEVLGDERADAESLGSTLEALVRSGSLLRDGGCYAFPNELAREVAEATLLRGRRRELNRRAAAAIWRRDGDEASSLLAMHWARAGEPAKAYAGHCRAADMAAGVSALPEALVHIDAAVSLAGDLDLGLAVQAELMTRRAALRSRTGDARGAQADASQAVEVAERIGRDDLRQLALEELAFALEGAVDYRAAVEAQRAALRLAEERGDIAGQVRSHARLAINSANRLRYLQAYEHCQQAMQLAEAVGADPLLAAAMDASSQVALQLGEVDELERLGRRLTELHRAARDMWREQSVQLELGISAGEQARWDEAESRILAGLALNRQVDDVGNEPLFYGQLAALARARGRWAEAIEGAGRGSVDAHRRQHAEWIASTQLVLANTYTDIGDWESAVTAAGESIEWADRAGTRMYSLRARAFLALALARAGSGSASATALTDCRTLLAEVTVPPGRTFLFGWDAYAATSSLIGLTGDVPEALRLLDPVLISARTAGFGEATASLLLVRARLSQLRGDLVGSRAEAAAAVDVALDRGLSGLRWRAFAALAVATQGEARIEAERRAWAESEALLETLPVGQLRSAFDRLRRTEIEGLTAST